MKKFIKGCLITAAVFLAVGIVLAVAGASARGSEAISSLVESVTGGRVHLNFGGHDSWGFFVDEDVFDNLVDEEVSYDINDASMFDEHHEILKNDVAKYCPGTGIRSLDVEVGGCVFETKTSHDGEFYIEVKKSHKFQGYVEGDTLYIKASSGAKSWNKTGSCTITLYVPKDFCFEEAEVEMGAGIMSFSDLRASGKISLEAGAGQITADEVIGAELDINVGAGYIKLDYLETNKLDAEIGMGGFTAQGQILEEADIQCSMGNVDFTVYGSEKDFNYEIECAMGKIGLGSDTYSGVTGDKTIENGASKNMSVECAMGNITIDFKRHH